MCQTISLCKCTASPSYLLHILSAVKTVLLHGHFNWERLYIFPSLDITPTNSEKDNICHELRRLSATLCSQTRLSLVAGHGQSQTSFPTHALHSSDLVWNRVFRTSTEVARFCHYLKREQSGEGVRPTREHFFSGCIEAISRSFFDKQILCSNLDGAVEDAIHPTVTLYVQEMLRSLTTLLVAKLGDADPKVAWCQALRLNDVDLAEFLFGIDDAIYLLLNMHRICPAIPRCVHEAVLPHLWGHLPRSQAYMQRIGFCMEAPLQV